MVSSVALFIFFGIHRSTRIPQTDWAGRTEGHENHENNGQTPIRGSGSNGTKSAIGDTGTAHHAQFPAENLPLMLGRTSDGARPHLTPRLCINSCIYLWTAIPLVFWAESNFRFRCYRTPVLSEADQGALRVLGENLP